MVGRRETGWRGRQRTREYDKPVGLPGDVAHVRFVTEGNTVTAYTLQYEPGCPLGDRRGAPSGGALRFRARPAAPGSARLGR